MDMATFSWLGFLGWCLTMSSLWLLPAYAIYKYNITEVGFLRR